MARKTVSLRPRAEAQAAFDRLIELAERGPGMESEALIDAINRFLAFSRAPSDTSARWNWFTKADKAEAILGELRKGLDKLRAGRPFTRPVGWDEFEDGIVWVPARGHVGRLPTEDPRHLFFSRVFDLLTEVAPWMRLCRREGCGRIFLYHRPKQLFCSDSCAQLVRMERFLDLKKRRRSLRPKAARTKPHGTTRTGE